MTLVYFPNNVALPLWLHCVEKNYVPQFQGKGALTGGT